MRTWAVCAAAGAVQAQATIFAALAPLAGDYQTWLNNASTFRTDTIELLQYNATSVDNSYNAPSLLWTSAAATIAELQLSDLLFSSPLNYTASAYLNDLQQRIGPVDAVILWAQLPVLGLDFRGQADIFRQAEVTRAIAALQAAAPALKIFLGWAPWDEGTAPDVSGLNGSALLSSFQKNMSANGCWLRDTGAVDAAAARHSNEDGSTTVFAVAVEGDMPNEAPAEGNTAPLSYVVLSRSLGLQQAPGSPANPSQLSVSTLRWLEARHVPAIGNPWSKNRTIDILTAFVNGAATVVTENVFGGFTNLLTPRDAALLSRASNITRFLAPFTSLAQATQTGDFNATRRSSSSMYGGGDDPSPMLHVMPMWPLTLDAPATVTATLRTAPCPSYTTGAGAPVHNCTVLLFANLGDSDAVNMGVNISVTLTFANVSASNEAYFYDLYKGVQLSNFSGASNDVLNITVEAGGIAAIFALHSAPTALVTQFLSTMVNLTAVPLANFSAEWAAQKQTMSPLVPTAGSPAAPPGMALISGAYSFTFYSFPLWPEMFLRPEAAEAVAGLGVDVQYPWEAAPTASHAPLTTTVFPFYLDIDLVTHDDYAAFLKASGYSGGEDRRSFLLDWIPLGNGTYAVNASNGDGARPVVWVSRDDAQAYCKWLGKRLPAEPEWTYAAQALAAGGSDYRQYPWGNASCAVQTKACPQRDNSTDPRPADPVRSYPAGASDLRLMDLVGNVWQMTDSYCDMRTCAVVLKGGSLYAPADAQAAAAGKASRYFPNPEAGVRVTEHARLPYSVQSQTRSAYVGFRCAADTPQSRERGTFAAVVAPGAGR